MTDGIKLRISAFDKATKTIRKVSQNLRKAGREALKANKKFSKLNMKLKQIGKSAQKMGRKMSGVGKSMTSKLTVPILGAGAGVLRMAFNFQKAMNKVGSVTQTVINGKPMKAFEMLQKRAKELGATTEFSATQVAEAMGKLGTSGFSPKEIDASIESILQLATATGVGIPEAAEAAAGTIRAFGLEAKDAGRVADVFAFTAANTNTTLDSLSESMSQVSTIAKTYGASLEETSALVGMLGDVNIKGGRSGVVLKNMFLKLAVPMDKAKGFMRDLNIQTQDSEGGMRRMTDILADLAPKLKQLPKAKQLEVLNELFGKRAVAGGASLIDKLAGGDKKLLNLIKNLDKATGTSKEMQTTMNMGIVGAMNRFNSAMEGAALAIANSGLLEFFEKIIVKMTDWFTEIRNTSPELLKLGLKIAGIVAIAGPFLVVLGSIVSALGTSVIAFVALKGAIAGGTIAVGGMTLAMAPLLLGIAKFALISLAVVESWKFLKKLVIDTKNSWSKEESDKSRMAIFEEMRKRNGGKLPEGMAAQFGPELGAQRIKANADNREFVTRNNNAKVQVDFRGMPEDALVKLIKDKDMDVEILNGPMGN